MKMHARRLHVLLVGIMLLSAVLSGCQLIRQSEVSPATVEPPSGTSTPSPSPSPKTPYPTFPPTWTPKPLNALKTATITPTWTATHNLPATIVALTTVASGVHCERHPDAWKVYNGPAGAVAGWCLTVGAFDTLYEYKVLSPDGWVVNTFGEFTPNLAFSTRMKNVDVRLYQAFAYGTYNYTGTLEDAPEQARICDYNLKCYGFLNPHEVIVRQQIIQSDFRDVLVLDSKVEDNPNGVLNFRRYYTIIPFTRYNETTHRLFILEMVWLGSALNEEEYDELIEKLEIMVPSIGPR